MPTEELFGAYHILLAVENSSRRAQFSNKLRAAGINLSHKGLEQVLKAEAVSSLPDRQALAKLVAQTEESGTNIRPSGKGQASGKR